MALGEDWEESCGVGGKEGGRGRRGVRRERLASPIEGEMKEFGMEEFGGMRGLYVAWSCWKGDVRGVVFWKDCAALKGDDCCRSINTFPALKLWKCALRWDEMVEAGCSEAHCGGEGGGKELMLKGIASNQALIAHDPMGEVLTMRPE